VSLRVTHFALACFAAATVLVPQARAATVDSVVFSDQIYADADWSIVGANIGLISAGQVATGGNLRSYRQVVLGVGQNVPYVGQVNRNFVYDPTRGAVAAINYTMDLITTNAEGAAYAALVEQGGKLYADAFPTEVANASSNTWLGHSINLTLSNFSQVVRGQFGALAFDNTSHPDFSTSGRPLTFGYLVAAGFFTSITGIDNDPITLRFTPAAVAEPGLMMLFGSGLGCLLLWRRRKAE
jgi:hypothetical protein